MFDDQDSIRFDSEDENEDEDQTEEIELVDVSIKELNSMKKKHKKRLKELFRILKKEKIKMKYIIDLISLLNEKKD